MTTLLQMGVLTVLLAALAYLGVVTLVTLVAALRSGGRREDALDDDALAGSRFTMPVSVVIPLCGGHAQADRAIAAALAFEYPEFEVIVVAEGLTDTESARLRARWDLSPREYLYRQVLATAPVTHIYRSTADPRLVFVEKAGAGMADALNCGVTLAQYRYVVGIDPGLTFDRDALIRSMTPVLRDPAQVVAVSTHVERLDDSSAASAGLLRDFQRLASLRSLMETRLAWQTLRAGLGPQDAVVVWRRDAIIQARGFSTRAADPALDMMIGLQAEPGPDTGRVARQWDLFGSLAPVRLGAALRRAVERRRAVVQTIWAPEGTTSRHVTRMSADMRQSLRWFFVSEMLTPAAVVCVVVLSLAAASAGWLPWIDVAAIGLVLSFGRALLSGAALLVRGALPGSPDPRALRRLIAAGPLEFVCYDTPRAIAKVVTW